MSTPRIDAAILDGRLITEAQAVEYDLHATEAERDRLKTELEATKKDALEWKQYGAGKDHTATVFMNQVKGLQQRKDALQTALRNLVDIVERVQASQSRFGYIKGRDSSKLETKLDAAKALLPEAKL